MTVRIHRVQTLSILMCISWTVDALSDSALPLSSSPQIDSKSLSSTSNCNETPRRQILDPHNDSVELAPAIYPTPPTQSSSTIPRKQDLADQGPAIHSASCYFCDSRIVGDRYVCSVPLYSINSRHNSEHNSSRNVWIVLTSIPAAPVSCMCFELSCKSSLSFSFCRITPQQHPDHAFVRIKAPGDHIVWESIMPVLQRYMYLQVFSAPILPLSRCMPLLATVSSEDCLFEKLFQGCSIGCSTTIYGCRFKVAGFLCSTILLY